MFIIKKNVYFIIIFLTILLAFNNSLAKEELTKKPFVQNKAEGTQKKVPPFTIKGAKIEIVPVKTTSEKQKEGKKEHLPRENQPQILIDSTHYDVGEVWEGEEIIHTFRIKNIGGAELNIKRVDAG